MEFRRYDKINCSLFDLIYGDLEPKQTMSLGYTLAKSQGALKALLKLLGLESKISYDQYVVDCEAQRHGNNNDRIDILIRFYKGLNPVQAIIIEAKSVRATTSVYTAAYQIPKYSQDFPKLKGFDNNVTLVVLTRDSSVSNVNDILSLTWSQLISTFQGLPNNIDNYELVNDFVNFIVNIKGGMNYYEEEILAIPAGTTFNAIKESGIYECPVNYNTHKKSLYLTFKAAKGGDMTILYKLIDKYVIDINDTSAIDIIDQHSLKGFKSRIANYLKSVGVASGIKQIYVLDIDNPIILPNTVRPVENNTAPAYYSLCDFLAPINSNINRVIVQKNIWIDENNKLNINTNGKKQYDVYDSNGTLIKSFKAVGNCELDRNIIYTIKVNGSKRKVSLTSIEIKFINNKWNYSYVF